MATNPMSPVGIKVINLFDRLSSALKVQRWYASSNDCPPVAHDLIEEEITEVTQALRDLTDERSRL